MMIGCNAAHGVRIGRIIRRGGSWGGRTRTTVTQIVHGWSHRTMRLPGRCGHGRDNTLNSLRDPLFGHTSQLSVGWANFKCSGQPYNVLCCASRKVLRSSSSKYTEDLQDQFMHSGLRTSAPKKISRFRLSPNGFLLFFHSPNRF